MVFVSAVSAILDVYQSEKEFLALLRESIFIIEPVRFQLERADPLVQPRLGFITVVSHVIAPVGEKLGQNLQKLGFQSANLARVDAIFSGYLGYGFLSLDVFKGELNL